MEYQRLLLFISYPATNILDEQIETLSRDSS